MAAFCNYWHIGPAEYKALTLEETQAMTEWANKRISEQERAARASRRKR